MNTNFRFLSMALLCLCLFSCGENSIVTSDPEISLSKREASDMTALLYLTNQSTTTISLSKFSAQPIDQNTFTFTNITSGPVGDTYTVTRVDIVEPDNTLLLKLNSTDYEDKSGVTIRPKSSTSIESKVFPDDVTYTSPNVVGDENDEI